MMSAIGFKIIPMTITVATVVLVAVAVGGGGRVVVVGVVRRVQMKLCCYC